MTNILANAFDRGVILSIGQCKPNVYILCAILKSYRCFQIFRNSSKNTCPQVCWHDWDIKPIKPGVNYITVYSLDPGRWGGHFKSVISERIKFLCIYCEIALRWMPLNSVDEKSTLFQVMVWSRQRTSHYLSQYWHRFMSKFGVIRTQWVNRIYKILCLI